MKSKSLGILWLVVAFVVGVWAAQNAQAQAAYRLALPLVAKAAAQVPTSTPAWTATPAPASVPTLRAVNRVTMPYGCLGGDSPLALYDGRGGWLIECFRVDSPDGSGAAPVYWLQGRTFAEPINVGPVLRSTTIPRQAEPNAVPDAAPVTDCRGAWGYRPDTDERYYFSWDCSQSSRRPVLVVSKVVWP